MQKISICLPTRNRAEMLRTRSIPSVINQTYRNWELLIVGDCCTDNSEEVVKSFNDERIKWFNLPEKIYHYPKDDKKAEWLAGPVMALNKCLEMVSGDWIARLDDDDYWLPSCLEKLLVSVLHENIDFVSASYAMTLPVGNRVISPIRWEFERNIYYIGGVQTWLYSAKYKDIKYNPDCWKKRWFANNEYDLLNNIFKAGAKIVSSLDVVAIIAPRPNLDCIGSKAYLKEADVKG